MIKSEEVKKLLERIAEIKLEISTLGELRTGSLTEQYNVCGQQHCKCKDKKNPRKHGPYYQLSYTRYKKSTSEFVSKERVDSVRQQLADYKSFMRLKDEWIDISIQLAKLTRKKK